MDLSTISKWTTSTLNQLIYIEGLIESQTIEFKKQVSVKNGKLDTFEFAKDVTAFANSNGGHLFIGIDEKPRGICGTLSNVGNQKLQDWIANTLNDVVAQSLDYKVYEVPISENSHLSVFIIQVLEGDNKPYFVWRNKSLVSFVRKGTSIFGSKPDDLDRMFGAKYSSTDPSINIKQKAKGKNINQIGQVITTKPVKQVTEVLYDPDYHISEEQAKKIKGKVDEIVKINNQAGKLNDQISTGKLYRKTWNFLYDRYGITTYKLLPKEEYEDCVKWLQKQIAGIHVPKLRRVDNKLWRNKRYTSIYTKIKELGMSKEELFQFALGRLPLSQPISSISELKEQKLDKLYKLIRALKSHDVLIKVFEKDQNIHGIYSNGKEKQLSFHGTDSKPILIKSKAIVVFLRSEKRWSHHSKKDYKIYKLMTLKTLSLEERLLIDQKPFADGQDASFELLSPRNLVISPDQSKVMFIIEKYATGSQLVQVDLESARFEELFSAEKFEFINSGEFRGQLLVGVSEVGNKGRDVYYKVTNLAGKVLKTFSDYEEYMSFRSSALATD